MNDEIIQKVANGSIIEIYNLFITLKEDFVDFDDIYPSARFGVKVKFDIYDLWEDTPKIIIKPKSEKVIISGDYYSLTEYRTEKEKRRTLMSKAIIKHYKDNLPYDSEKLDGK